MSKKLKAVTKFEAKAKIEVKKKSQTRGITRLALELKLVLILRRL